MNGTAPVFPVIRAAQCLAINGDQLSLRQGVNSSHPFEKAGLELLGFDGRNGASYGVVSRNTGAVPVTCWCMIYN